MDNHILVGSTPEDAGFDQGITLEAGKELFVYCYRFYGIALHIRHVDNSNLYLF